jgi:hypothetical protein
MACATALPALHPLHSDAPRVEPPDSCPQVSSISSSSESAKVNHAGSVTDQQLVQHLGFQVVKPKLMRPTQSYALPVQDCTATIQTGKAASL